VGWSIDLFKKGRQEWSQTIGQEKPKKAGEAAVDRQVDQLINKKKVRQERPQAIGQAKAKAKKAGEAAVGRSIDQCQKKAEEAAVDWLGESKEGRRDLSAGRSKKTEHETDGLSTKANQRFFFFGVPMRWHWHTAFGTVRT